MANAIANAIIIPYTIIENQGMSLCIYDKSITVFLRNKSTASIPAVDPVFASLISRPLIQGEGGLR